MPRKQRTPSPTGIYHWINRGIHRKKIFHHESDFDFFLSLVLELKTTYNQKIHHYCLMDNHIHILLHSEDTNSLSSFSHFLARRYVYYYHEKYKWIGSVFQGRYKALPVDNESYVLECARYIERNPLSAKIVTHLQEYSYSSFRGHIGLKTDNLIDFSPSYLELSDKEEVRQRMYEHYVLSERLDGTAKSKELKLV